MENVRTNVRVEDSFNNQKRAIGLTQIQRQPPTNGWDPVTPPTTPPQHVALTSLSIMGDRPEVPPDTGNPVFSHSLQNDADNGNEGFKILEDEIRQLRSYIEVLDLDIGGRNSKIETLQNENSRLRQRCEVLEKENYELRRAVTSIELAVYLARTMVKR